MKKVLCILLLIALLPLHTLAASVPLYPAEETEVQNVDLITKIKETGGGDFNIHPVTVAFIAVSMIFMIAAAVVIGLARSKKEEGTVNK